MNKGQILERLEEMAILLELNDANPFKIRAYQNALRTLESAPQDLAGLLDGGLLEQLKGIGKGLSTAQFDLYYGSSV